jgi:hypothetical protein
MFDYQEQLESRLRQRGWVVHWKQYLHPDPERGAQVWWVEGHVAPYRGLALIEFRILGGSRYYWNFDVIVRPLKWSAQVPSVEVVFNRGLASRDEFRQVFRALAWFTAPEAWPVMARASWPDDWTPPQEWFSMDWPATMDGAALWANWLAPEAMIDFVRSGLSVRKQYLLACALCRASPLTMLSGNNVRAMLAVEQYAEGLAPRRQMKSACKHSDLGYLAQLEPPGVIREALARLHQQTPAQAPQLAADAIREVMMNPFRPIDLRHSWLRRENGSAGHLANAIQRDQRFDELPILADALEDAGCDEPTLLEHLRRPEGHLRGCWALDLVCRKDQEGHR